MRVTSLKTELFAAQDAANVADEQWQAALDSMSIDRYSKAARGASGSLLRALYDAKVAADDKCHELTATMRRYQDVTQIARP